MTHEPTITKDQTIQDVVQQHPEVVPILKAKGFHCMGCGASEFENIEQGAIVHGLDPKTLLEELNASIAHTITPTSQARYRIEHDIPGCIGCSACAAIHPNNWEMKEVDGEIKALPKKEHFDDGEFELNNEAAEVCPVNVIHIHDQKMNKKII